MSEPNSFEKWRDRYRPELETVLANAHAEALTEEDVQWALETVRRALKQGKPGRPPKKLGDLRKDTRLEAAVNAVEQLHSQGESYERALHAVGRKRGYSSRHLQKHAWMARISMPLTAAFAPISDLVKRLQSLVPKFTHRSPDE